MVSSLLELLCRVPVSGRSWSTGKGGRDSEKQIKVSEKETVPVKGQEEVTTMTCKIDSTDRKWRQLDGDQMR